MKKWTVIIGLLLVLSLVLVSACATSTPTPTKPAPATTAAPTTAAPTTAAPTTAKPPTTTAAISAADFYKNNTVTIYVGSKPGGGTDYCGRIFSAYWNEATGGTMIVKNEPGGGGLVNLNNISNAKADGLTIGTAQFGAHVLSFMLLGAEGVNYNPTKFNYVGGWGFEPYVLATGLKSPYSTVDDLKKAKGLVFGVAEPVGTTTSAAALAIDALGLDAKMVAGFRGADAGLAAAKVEIAAYCQDGADMSVDFGKGFIKPPLLSINVDKSTYFPDAPTLPSVATLNTEQTQVLKLLSSLGWQNVIFAPPGVPADRVKVMQDAFNKIVVNAGFIQQAKLRWGLWNDKYPYNGQKCADIVNQAMDIPKDALAAYTKMTQKYLK